MPVFQITSTASEKEGARLLLNAMLEVPPAAEALRMIEQQTSIPQVGRWLQNNIMTAFREEQEHNEQLRRDLQHLARDAVSLRQLLDAFQADPLEQQRKLAEKARGAAEHELHEAQRQLEEEREKRTRERNFHQDQIRELKLRVTELNRLIANQHKRLDGLIGSGSPE